MRLNLVAAGFALALLPAPVALAQTATAAAPSVDVQLPIARKETIYVTSSGRTSAFQRVDLMARVPGFLEKIGYEDGATVKSGTPLFTIEQAPYQASVDSAQAGVASAQAQVAQASADLARQTKLTQSQIASVETLDQSQATSKSADASLQEAQAQLEQSQIDLSYTTITAPFDGVVTARTADLGALVGASGPSVLATIMQTDKLYVTFTVTESQVLQVKAALAQRGQTLKDIGQITVDVGVATDDGYPHQGVIDYIAPEIDTGTGTLTVRAVLDNTKHELLPGLFVRVRIPVQKDVDSLLVPEAALGNDQRGRYVLVVDKDNKVQERPIVVGSAVDGGLVIVKSGIEATDQVIVGGLSRAAPGSTVTAKLLSAPVSE
ncbi:MAG: efflux transporter periplasmic adaptor subunit [Cereibacter sphaeroides]|uniref:Efflux transporter periplasmic adaptor subunit n=1 Tax=Cereibacter sphaeroides TaxID=1063 RepID=A0A2W5S959_CERSP|nr:MAG: efflux transporter periplasmic adaptor subunit [Cereibacter sphaeroides]